MKIEFPFEITAADKESRIIEGRVVAFNETGNTSAGLTQFADNSIEFAPVKLLLEHDRTRPIGKSISFEQVDGAVIGKFKLANTTAATDALEEAATGLRSAFSVGVMVDAWDVKDNVNIVTASKLIEVSLVTDPAIKSATVQRVAASEQETKEEGSTMTNPEVEEVKTDLEVEVEASHNAPVAAAQPVTFTKPRLNINKVDYLANSIKAAAYGDHEARQYVMAADDTTSNNAGLIPTPQLGEIINPLSTSNRAFIDAISRGTLPAAGMTFEIPKLTAIPTVDEVAEADDKIIVATYGVAAVGINIPRIFNLVLIEPGKSFVRVIQSIGRGIRKAEDKDFVQIWDITSTCKYAKRHLTKRKAYYKDAQYPFTHEKLEWN